MMQTRLLPSTPFSPGTFNRDRGTVEAVISTGAPVQRGGYIERLAIGQDAVTMQPNTPVLDAHRQASIKDVLGRVENVRFERGAIIATLRISSPAALDAIERGDLTGVSIGYRVTSWADTRADGVLTRTAAKWVLLEVSLVPLPADAGAVLRSDHMSETIDTTTTTGGTQDRTETDRAIRTVCIAAGMDTAFTTELIGRGVDLPEARRAVLDAMLARNVPVRTQRVDAGGGETAVQLGRMQEALVCRILPGQKPSDAARPYMGLSMVDMARSLLQLRGEAVNTMSREAIVQRAMHTTSDFPNLLTGTGNRVLMTAYQAAPNPLKQLARQATMDDFRPKSLLKISEMGPLQKVSEHGEIKSTSRSETREGYSLDTFATIFSLTRKAIINDDLGAFSDWSVAMGRAAAETEAAQLVALLTANAGAGPTMGDGKALFHAGHGNLAGSGDAISNVNLGTARTAMRTMKGVDGKTPINASPAFLLVAPGRETEAEQLLAAIYAATAGTTNSFAGKLTLLVEPRLPAGAWYVFADPAVLPVLEYAYLSSAQGPQMASRDGWDVLGTEFRVVLDFGCGAIDWRGAFRNPGN